MNPSRRLPMARAQVEEPSNKMPRVVRGGAIFVLLIVQAAVDIANLVS